MDIIYITGRNSYYPQDLNAKGRNIKVICRGTKLIDGLFWDDSIVILGEDWDLVDMASEIKTLIRISTALVIKEEDIKSNRL